MRDGTSLHLHWAKDRISRRWRSKDLNSPVSVRANLKCVDAHYGFGSKALRCEELLVKEERLLAGVPGMERLFLCQSGARSKIQLLVERCL